MSHVTALPARAVNAPANEGIALADLYLSDMNPRQEADPDGIVFLADSIAMIGLIQPVAGFRDVAGKVGVFAAGRRWRVIRLALERDPDLLAHRLELAFVPLRLPRMSPPAAPGPPPRTPPARTCTPPTRTAPSAGCARAGPMCRPSPAPSASPRPMCIAASPSPPCLPPYWTP